MNGELALNDFDVQFEVQALMSHAKNSSVITVIFFLLVFWNLFFPQLVQSGT